jgi:hypothetical protein
MEALDNEGSLGCLELPGLVNKAPSEGFEQLGLP